MLTLYTVNLNIATYICALVAGEPHPRSQMTGCTAAAMIVALGCSGCRNFMILV